MHFGAYAFVSYVILTNNHFVASWFGLGKKFVMRDDFERL